MPRIKEKSNSQKQLEQELETIKENAERVRQILINRNAEDLIPILLGNLDELTMPVRELAGSPNGPRKSRK